MLKSRKSKNWLKMGALVLLGVVFSVKIKDVIGKYAPAVRDVLDKGEQI